ncbi:FACT complex subunit SSRP1-like isoform X1 [Lytechinus variegatus]|uniref:FACT complex subunit SSRP1-like isoform X1 n=1 Tax=Lytechinus variegatus TaxID=7654 RepID=UPI001BB11F06|nr:FACT complex subunit SSRP1-like isoform X1 [Lytechinus variegatus]
METLDFPDVSQEVKGAMNGGRLRLSEQGVTFKNNKTGKVDQIQSGDLERTNWIRVARGHELKLYLKSGSIFKYDGFKESDREKVADFLQRHYNVELQDKELSLKGWNWGTARFEGSELDFHVDKKSAFQLPLGNVCHATTAKNEVILEFHQNDDAEVSLMEMRFYVPSTDSTTDAAGAFLDNVMAKADIIQATGDAICSLEEIPCLTPRGRYDIKIFPTFLQLHGKTFDYKIPFTTVLRLFLLPHKDNRQMFFVMSLDPPIVQGQTRYHFLILSFNKEDTLALELNLTEDELEQKYEGKLTKEMSGPMFEIVSRIMKCLVARKITVPGNFKGHKGAHAISCSYKSNSGFLYPLERGFMYVHKPPMHIRFDEIQSVNFAGTGSLRYFDFEIETRNKSTFVFSSIEKDDYTPLFTYVSSKKLRVKNRGMKGDTVNYDDIGDSDDDNTHDAYLEQMKAEGREREEGEIDENDSDSSSDEDFNPLESASDVAEEYDSNIETDSSDSDYTAGSGEEEEDDDDYRKEREERKERKRQEKEREKQKAKQKKRTKTSSDKPRKKVKKEKDANKPKRAATAYMLWLNETREELKEKYPGISVVELTKKAGELWQKLDDKTKWNEIAAEKKKEYEAAMAEYRERAAEEGYEPAVESGSSGKKSKSSSDKSKSKSKKTSPSPKKSSAGSGGNYKSKEYISESESSSDEEKSEDGGSDKEENASSPVEEEPSSPVEEEDGAEADDDEDDE